MLSRQALQLLKWMQKHDEWLYEWQIERSYPPYDYRLLRGLVENGLVDHDVPEDAVPTVDEYQQEVYLEHYRINDAGRAHLESRIGHTWREIRAWVTLAVAAAAFVVSVILPLSG